MIMCSSHPLLKPFLPAIQDPLPFGLLVTLLVLPSLIIQTSGIYNECKKACNEKRNTPSNETIGLYFHCTDFLDPQKEQSCRKTCSGCPNYVCDQNVTTNRYRCPPVNYNWLGSQSFHDDHDPYELCRLNCNFYRLLLQRIKSENAFFVNCTDLDIKYQTKCAQDCNRCPRTVCYPANGATYKCPRKNYDWLEAGPNPDPDPASVEQEEFSSLYITLITLVILVGIFSVAVCAFFCYRSGSCRRRNRIRASGDDGEDEQDTHEEGTTPGQISPEADFIGSHLFKK